MSRSQSKSLCLGRGAEFGRGYTPCLTMIQVLSSAQPIVETATFGSRATCEQFVKLSRSALNEEAKPSSTNAYPWASLRTRSPILSRKGSRDE